ncbi:hypothetical protein [Neobacillus massiliamazoniensis]|uniref:Uncharacterized protein n=1 Tax=Neobacillus massiliamazoniensis TaxID=1499688 RepID=A0A0U1NXS6_9BACI|nr:hypothetical protein [Neobacillus massiliamazoniensis]CRK82830.1 hypothetical protein BN000_02781 [Neobacillus massiliamazoniensis]
MQLVGIIKTLCAFEDTSPMTFFIYKEWFRALRLTINDRFYINNAVSVGETHYQRPFL